MEGPCVISFDCGPGNGVKRVQFDINLFELGGKQCSDCFREKLRGGIEDMDLDYKMFLECLIDSCCEEGGSPSSEGDDEVDPDYMMVRNNLIPCGKSCALKVDEGKGMLVLVEYEGVDDSDEYWDSLGLREMSRMNDKEEICGGKLSKYMTDKEEMYGGNGLRNLRSKENVESWRILTCQEKKQKKSSLLEKVLRSECMNTVFNDTEEFRKRGRVDLGNNQIVEPDELLNRSGLRQACKESRNSVEGVKIAVTNQNMGVNNKEVENHQILRSATGVKEQRDSVSRKEMRLRVIDPPLRKSKNSDEYWDSLGLREMSRMNDKEEICGGKLSEDMADREEMCGGNGLMNLRSKENVECLRGLMCLEKKQRKSSLGEKVLRSECMNTDFYDKEEFRKRRRVDLGNNQIAEPHEQLNRSGLRQACRQSRNSVEGVKIAVTKQNMGVNNKEVENHRILSSVTGVKEQRDSVSRKEMRLRGIDPPRNMGVNNKEVESHRTLRSATGVEEQRDSVSRKEMRLRGIDPPLRNSKNSTERGKLKVTTPSRHVGSNRKSEDKRILRSSNGTETRKSTVEKGSRQVPASAIETCRRSGHNNEDLKNVENSRKVKKRRISRSDQGIEKMSMAEKKLRCEPQVSPQASSKSRNIIESEHIDVTDHLKIVVRNNCEIEDNEIDRCYQLFLNGIDNYFELESIDNNSDSELLMWDYDPSLLQDINNPFVHAKAIVPIDEEDSEKEVYLFRREVMGILKRPYEQKEYEDLLEKIQAKKPMEVRKRTRRWKSVSMDVYGKSYLEHYPDLKKKIDTVEEDPGKVLNILRGFFFWLEREYIGNFLR